MDVDTISKIVQAAFYITAGCVAVLTYITAKNGLLNTVNTEYHKKVIDRLSSLSEELYEEFDDSSPKHWVRERPTKELVNRINEQARKFKHEILTSKGEPELPIGIPVTETENRLMNLSRKYRSDPFLPEPVRSSVVALLEGRLGAMGKAHAAVTDHYLKLLAQGKHWENLDDNESWLHNMITQESSF
jgi:hypothetical protein